MDNVLITKIENYVSNLYNENNPSENVYHNLSHTKKVVEIINDICNYNKIDSNNCEILTIAAWFHDVGHIFTWEGHEDISIKFAKKYLINNDYDNLKIEKVCNCIHATRLDVKPQNHLEQIICDADLSYLGSNDFFKRSSLLRKEMEVRKKTLFSDLQWLMLNKEFIEGQEFYTDYGKKKLNKIKKLNLEKINSQLLHLQNLEKL